jgi:signal transduction histidine kinase
VLRARAFNEDTCRRALEAIERNALAQVQVIDDLREVSEVMTGKVRLNLRPLDLVMLIRDAITVARLAVDARAIRVEATLDPAAAAFVGDLDRLQRAVANVLATAAMAAPVGGCIEVRLEQAHGHPQITVRTVGEAPGGEGSVWPSRAASWRSTAATSAPSLPAAARRSS